LYLFFDTETTGIPRNYKAPVTDLDNWPRLVQIAWLVSDVNANEITSSCHIVKPDGFTIPEDAARVHGITTERALTDGIALQNVLDELIPHLQRATVLVAHNMQFDEKILGAELLRMGHPNVLLAKQRVCTMQSSTNYCQLPGRYGYKWPTLQELHDVLFNQSFGDAHNALADVRACARCFHELRTRRVMY